MGSCRKFQDFLFDQLNSLSSVRLLFNGVFYQSFLEVSSALIWNFSLSFWNVQMKLYPVFVISVMLFKMCIDKKKNLSWAVVQFWNWTVLQFTSFYGHIWMQLLWLQGWSFSQCPVKSRCGLLIIVLNFRLSYSQNLPFILGETENLFDVISQEARALILAWY